MTARPSEKYDSLFEKSVAWGLIVIVWTLASPFVGIGIILGFIYEALKFGFRSVEDWLS